MMQYLLNIVTKSSSNVKMSMFSTALHKVLYRLSVLRAYCQHRSSLSRRRLTSQQSIGIHSSFSSARINLESCSTKNISQNSQQIPFPVGFRGQSTLFGGDVFKTALPLDTNPIITEDPRRSNATYSGGAVGLMSVRDATQAMEVSPIQEELCPHALAEPDLLNLFADIRKEFKSSERELEDIACYYFDGEGKAIRPIINVLMARAVNQEIGKHHRILASQFEIAKVSEMIHTASLLHDDVLDMADTRRGKASVTTKFGQKKSVMAGDYILSKASTMVAQLHNPQVTIILSKVLSDLVQGEFMQLSSKENERERFSHYLSKTYKKTASLIANSCQAVAVLGGADKNIQDICYQYGRNIGIAFQLVDDYLDFEGSSKTVGKPTAVDLKLGFATAPVLFASEKFPRLNAMILRRFESPGDVEYAFECVRDSDGLQQTQRLAKHHCNQAITVLETLIECEEKTALKALTDKVLFRIR